MAVKDVVAKKGERTRQVYDLLVADGADVGSFDEFNRWLYSEGERGYANRQRVYEAFRSDGADVGTYDEFRDWLNGGGGSGAASKAQATAKPVGAAKAAAAVAPKAAKPVGQGKPKAQGGAAVGRMYSMRSGGKDFQVSEADVVRAGGFDAWAARNASRYKDLRVYMRNAKGERVHTDVGNVKRRAAEGWWAEALPKKRGEAKAYQGERTSVMSSDDVFHTPFSFDNTMRRNRIKMAGGVPENEIFPVVAEPKGEPGQESGSAGAKAVGSVTGAKAVGVEVDAATGGKRTVYELPDGSRTSDISDVTRSLGGALKTRVSRTYEREFKQRMKGNGLDPENERDVQIQQIDDRISENERKLKRIYAERERKLQEHENEGDTWDRFVHIVGGAANRSVTGNAPKPEQNLSEQDNVIKDLLAENLMLAQQGMQLKSSKDLKKAEGMWNGTFDVKNNVRNLYAGVRDKLMDPDLYAMGAVALHNGERLERIKSKLESGGELTGSELNLAESAALIGRSAQYVDVPHMYTAGQVTTEMIPFMVQMAANPASGLSRGLVKKYGNTMAKRIGLAIAGDVAEAAVLTNTLQAPKTVADIQQRHRGDIIEREPGQFAFEGGESWAKAIAKGEGASVIENYTELLGTHFGVISSAVGKGLSQAGRKVGLGNVMAKAGALVNNIRATDVAKGLAKVEKKANWNGVFGEVLEEEAGIVLNALTVGDNSLSDLVDAEQQIDILLGVGLFGGFLAGVKTAAYPAERMLANIELIDTERVGAYRFGDNWDTIRSRIEAADDRDLATVVRGLVVDYCESKEMAQSVMKYAQALVKARGFNLAKVAVDRENAEKNGGKVDSEAMREQAVESLAENSILENYENEAQGEPAGPGLNADGSPMEAVGRAVMKSEDRAVEVLSGRVAMMEDGSMVDVAGSDRSIVIRDVETGKVEMVAPEAILSYEDYAAADDGGVVSDGGNVMSSDAASAEVVPEDAASGLPEEMDMPRYGAGRIVVRDAEGSLSRGWLTGEVVTEDNYAELGLSREDIGKYEYYLEGNLNELAYASEQELDGMVSEFVPDEAVADDVLNSEENDVSLQESNDSDEYGAGFDQGTDAEGIQYDSGGVASGAASAMASDTDRGNIRVYETRIPAEQDGDLQYGQRNRREAESERLVGIAREQGQYIPKEQWKTLGVKKSKASGESVVYDNHEADGRVYKVKDPFAKAPLKGNVQPEEVVYEHLVHNKYFPETGYRFEGIGDELGDVRIVLSQPFIASVGTATKEQVEAALAEKGLFPEGNYRYGNDEVSVTDVTGDNALVGEDGRVYFIDPIIDFKRPAREILGESVGREAEEGADEIVQEVSRPLTESEADELLSRMETNAEQAKEIELTPENWVAMFGERGIVKTPVGDVKMGENQLGKLILRKRTEYFGMIHPTLTNPDVIVEKSAPAEGAERDTKYIFIKTFIKPDGSRIVHFESITVKKEGMEVSVSSHEAEAKSIKKEMQNGKILHLSDKLSPGSDGYLTKTPNEPEGPDLVPTSDNVSSEGKDNALLSDKQISEGENVPETVASVENVQQTALQRIPVDEQGVPVFEQAESPELAWDALVEFSDGDIGAAQEVADLMVDEKRKAFEKAQKLKSKGKNPAEILASRKANQAVLAQARGEFEMWQKIAGVERERQEAERRQREAEARAAKEAETAWQEQKRSMDRRVREVAEDLREYPEAIEILNDMEPHDIWEVASVVLSEHKVLLGDSGVRRGAMSEVGLGRGESRGLIGLFARYENGGRSIEALSEDYMKQECEAYGVPYEQGEARDALIELINSARTRGDIYGYIAKNRIGQAREVVSRMEAAQENAKAEYYRNMFGLDVEQGEAYEEQIMAELAEAARDFDEQAYNELLADEMDDLADAYEAFAEQQARKALENLDESEYNGNIADSDLIDKEYEDYERRRIEEDDPAAEGSGVGRGGEVLSGQGADNGAGEAAYASGRTVPGADGASVSGSEAYVGGKTGATGGGNVQSTDERKDNLQSSETEKLDYQLSDEVDDNGRQFVLNSKGAIEFGHINASTGLTEAPILLSEGVITNPKTNDGYGLIHIEARHGKQIRDNGYASVLEFIESVAANWSIIREGKDRNGNQTYRLIAQDSHNNTLMVELSEDGSYWNINTAGIFKNSYGKNNREIYNRHTTVNQSTETDEASQGAEQRGTTEPSRMNAPKSDGKDNSLSQDKQISEGESSSQLSDDKGAKSAQAALQAAVEAASAQVNVSPTPAQAEAGNYKKGHVTIGNFNITIENPAGSVRRGVDAYGNAWQTTMANAYGDIKGTESVDGDPIDVFLHNDMDRWNGRMVYVVDQTKEDGSFDEHKVMLGFNDKTEAMSAYLANYDASWAQTHPGLRISEVNTDDFNKWMQSSKRKSKPFADYSTVSKITDDAPTEAQKNDVQMSVGRGVEGNQQVYEAAKGMLEAAGIEVVTDKEAMRSEYEKSLPIAVVRQYSKELSPRDIGLDPASYAAKLVKISENLAEIAKKRENDTEWRGVISDLATAIGAKGGASKYVDIRIDDDHSVSIRISNHNADARNYASRGRFDSNISIVFKSRKSGNRFHSDERVELIEYVYTQEDIAKDGRIVAGIAQSLAEMLKTGEFKDGTGKAIINRSPSLLQAMTFHHGSPHKLVIFKESDARIANLTQFLRTSRGEVYGFVKDGKVYLDEELMNPATAVHEYTHLWDLMVQRENPELWARGKELMRQTTLWDEVRDDPAYADIRDDEDAVASEVHARLSGERGAEVLERMVDDARKDGALAVAGAVSLVSRLRQWLREMFEGLKKTLGKWSKRDLQELTVERFADMTLRDLAEGINPNVEIRRGEKTRIVTEANPMLDDYHRGVRKREDVMTFDEVLAEAEAAWDEYGDLTYPDMDIDMLRQAKRDGVITVYSSNPIEAGVFVTPSRMNAEDYAGGGHVYEKTVSVDDVAWTGEDEGQYAPSAGRMDDAEVRFDAAKSRGGERSEPGTVDGDKKSPANARQDLTTSSLHQPDAAKLRKISDNLQQLAEKYVGKTDKRGVFTDLADAVGATKLHNDSSSDYVTIAIPTGKTATIRISNHNANAGTFAKRGEYEDNVSIVIKSRKTSNTFQSHPEVELTEYVYTTEAIKKDGNMLSQVAESLRRMIETGEYVDLTGKAIVNHSPEVDSDFYGSEKSDNSYKSDNPYEADEASAGADVRFRENSYADRLEAIEALRPIEVEGNNMNKAELQQVYRSLPTVRKDGREVSFYHSAFKKIYKEGGLFGQIVPVLDEVLKQSVLAYSEADNLGGMVRPDGSVHKAHPNVDTFDNYVGKVSLDGKEYYVRTTVQRSEKSSAGTHSFMVTQIDLYENTANGLSLPITTRARGTNDGIVDAKLQQFFDKASSELMLRRSEGHRKGKPGAAEQGSVAAKRERVERMAESLNTAVRVVRDVAELTHPDAGMQGRMRSSKGWYNPVTGEVVVVLPNNATVEDVAATVLHEVVAHKGLRELIGEENYDAFCDEVYKHLKYDLKRQIDEETTRRFIDEPGKGYEHHRRVAVDELFGRMSEKGFEDFSQAERGIWAKLKAMVLEAINRFLGSLKLPKWVKLGDNELRYMLWRSHENLRGKGNFVDVARDMVKRQELGLDNDGLFRESRQAQELRRVNERFNEQLDKLASGEISGGELQLGKPGAVLRSAGINGIRITLDCDVLRKKMNESYKHEHPFDYSDVKNLPESINSPIAVFESKGHGDFNILVELNRDGKNFIVSLKARTKAVRGGEVVVDEIVTLYPKGEKGIVNWINSGLSKMIDKEKALEWLTHREPHAHKYTVQELDDAAKVIKNFENPAIEAEESDLRFRDGETGDIWNDRSVGLDERITNAAVRLARNQGEDLTLRNDAMRAIGGNLTKLRRAMAAQKRYDRSTVKRVADLARILMQNGYLSGMSGGEVQRLLSAVKNSVGEAQVEQSVQKVMDIMIQNQLRNAEATLRGLLAVRGSKVDARGVEVQGALDVDGQRTMEVVKKAMTLKEDDINDRIAEALNRMSDADSAIADNAAVEYAGLNMALDYVQNIAGSKADEQTLRDSLRTAKEDKDAGRLDKAAYKQFVEATEDALRKNRIERAEAYFNLVGRLSDSLRGSIENAKAFREAEKARVNHIHHLANSDMEGRELRGDGKDTRLQKFANSWLVRAALEPMSTFDQMLKMFGSKNPNGEGYLQDYFMRSWVDAADKEQVMKEHYHKLMDDKAAEIFGKRKVWYNGYSKSVAYSYSDLYDYAAALPRAAVTYHDGAEMREYEIEQGALLYLYAVEKMPMGRATNRRMGITDDVMQSITDALDPKLKEYADWAQEELLPQMGAEMDNVHVRMFGAHMDQIENYFPFVRDKDALKREVENGKKSEQNDRISVVTGAIKKRSASVDKWDMRTVNFFDVLARHIDDDGCHWSSFAELNRDIGTLLSYNRLKQQVFAMSSVYGAGEKLWNRFKDCAAIATEAYDAKTGRFDKLYVQGAKGVTMGKIALRQFTALKQTLSLPAFFGEVNSKYIVQDLMTGGVNACRWAWKNMPNYRKRVLSRTAGDYRLRANEYDDKIMKAASYGMLPNIGVDAWTIAVGSHGVYRTRKARYLRWGMDKEQAERRAIQDAELAFNKSQQSSEGPFMAPIQVDRTFAATTAMLFRNSSTSYTREAHTSARNLIRILSGEVSVDFVAKQILRTVGTKTYGQRFDEELSQQVAGTLPAGHIYSLGKPGGILQSAGFPDMPIEMAASRLAAKANQGNHVFPIEAVKGLVAALNNPLAVFRYGNNAMNVIVGLSYGGKQFLVGVHFNQQHRGSEVSDVRGLFPKDNAEWLNWISQGKATYMNHKKIQALIDQQRINLAEVEYLDLDDVAKVMENFENPDIPEQKTDRSWSESDWEKARRLAKQEIRKGTIRNTVNLAMFGWILPWLWRIGSIAPFLLLSSDDDEKEKQAVDAAKQSVFAPLEGFTYGDVITDGLNMLTGATERKWSNLGRSNPLISDFIQAGKKADYDIIGAANDVFNILAGMATGVNPQTITDWAVAIVDYCGDSPEMRNECAVLVARILNCPQSQLDQLYFEEIDMTAAAAGNFTPEQLAKRFAEYKLMREAPLTRGLYSEQERDSLSAKRGKKVLDGVKDAMETRVSTDRTRELVARYDSIQKMVRTMPDVDGESEQARNRRRNRLKRELYGEMSRREQREVKSYKKDMKELGEQFMRAESVEQMRSLSRMMMERRDSMLQKVGR